MANIIEKGNDADHKLHRSRMRKRFLKEGLESFEPHNVLEMILFFSISQGDTNETAHLLLDEFSTLSGVFEAPFDALKKVHGIGDQSAFTIKFLDELCRYYMNDKVKNYKKITSSKQAYEFFAPKFFGLSVEKLYILALDNKCFIKKCSLISEGGVTYTDVNMRKIVSEVINVHATNVILAHNHPHGLSVPSNEDVKMTENLSDLLSKLDIFVTDHIIVSQHDFFAMAKYEKFKHCFNHQPQKQNVADAPIYNYGVENETE